MASFWKTCKEARTASGPAMYNKVAIGSQKLGAEFPTRISTGAQCLGSSAPKGVQGKWKCSLRIKHLPQRSVHKSKIIYILERWKYSGVLRLFVIILD